MSPNSPHAEAGYRIDPPRSFACAAATIPDATAAADPPLDPLVDRTVSQGLRAGPNRTDSQAGTIPNSGVLVLPRMISSGAAKPHDELGVERRDVVLQEHRALGETNPGDLDDEVFHEIRNAAERSAPTGPGLGERALEHRRDDRVQDRIQLLDRGDRRFDQVERARVAAPDQLGLRGGVECGEL